MLKVNYIPNVRHLQAAVATVIILISACNFSTAFAADDKLGFYIDQFLKNNYDILINKYEIDKAQADFVTARLLPNPALSVNYTGLEFKGTPRSGDNTQLTFRLDQLIELGGKRELRGMVAFEGLESAKLLHKDTVRNLLSGFFSSFYNLRLDIMNVEASKEELRRFDKIMEIADRRYTAGWLSHVDYVKIKLSRVDAETTLSTLETQLRNDTETFALLTGASEPLDVNGITMQDVTGEVNEESLLQKAYDNRFDLLMVQRQQKAAQSALALAKAQNIPDISIGVERESYGPRNKPGFGAGFSISLPVFNRNQGDIQRKTAEYDQLSMQLEKVKKQIRTDIRLGLNNYRSSVAIVGSYELRRSEIEELLLNSKKAFALGGITVLDFLDTQKTYRDYILKLNQALVSKGLNRELLKLYTGEIR